MTDDIKKLLANVDPDKIARTTEFQSRVERELLAQVAEWIRQGKDLDVGETSIALMSALCNIMANVGVANNYELRTIYRALGMSWSDYAEAAATGALVSSYPAKKDDSSNDDSGGSSLN